MDFLIPWRALRHVEQQPLKIRAGVATAAGLLARRREHLLEVLADPQVLVGELLEQVVDGLLGQPRFLAEVGERLLGVDQVQSRVLRAQLCVLQVEHRI